MSGGLPGTPSRSGQVESDQGLTVLAGGKYGIDRRQQLAGDSGNLRGPLLVFWRRLVAWLSVHWPGRVVVRTLRSLNRVELFDRSTTIAAQLFTCIFPILILLASGQRGETRTE